MTWKQYTAAVLLILVLLTNASSALAVGLSTSHVAASTSQERVQRSQGSQVAGLDALVLQDNETGGEQNETGAKQNDTQTAETQGVELGELTVPGTITAGEPITISVPVQNPTDTNAPASVTFEVDQETVQTRNVTLSPNETRTVTVKTTISEDQNRVLISATTAADTETGLFRVEGGEQAADETDDCPND